MTFFINPLTNNVPIYRNQLQKNQLTGFYMMETLVVKGLITLIFTVINVFKHINDVTQAIMFSNKA